VILSQTLQETHRPRKVLHEMLRVGAARLWRSPTSAMARAAFHAGERRCSRTKLFPYDGTNPPTSIS